MAVLGVASLPAAATELVCAGQVARPAGAQSRVDRGRSAAKALPGEASPDPVARVHALVIYVQFGDQAAAAIPRHAASLFDAGLPGSLAHFYRTMSAGQFDLQGTVLPRRYASEEPASAFVARDWQGSGGYGLFAVDVLRQADRDVDYGAYDNDGPDGLPNSGDDDGYVDYVFINVLTAPRGFIDRGATGVAGLGFEVYLGTVDSGHRQSIRTDDHTPDGEPIRISSRPEHGAIQQEGSLSQTVGSMAHEFAHGLGLPDLYDLEYSGPEDDSAGVGQWDLMGWGAHGWHGDDGPAAFSAYSLEQLGWIGHGNDRLVEVSADTAGLRVDDVHAGGRIYRVPLGTGKALGALYREEYLLLEQRTRTFYSRGIPAEGLLVWHVRPVAGSNRDEALKAVDLVCADGLYADAGFPAGRTADSARGGDNLDFWAHDALYASAHAGNQGDATDPFDGVRYRQLSLGTNPSTHLRVPVASAYSGLSLAMRRQGAVMVVDLVQPRWAGTVRDTVHWGGRIHVDGDLQVAAGGTLILYEGTTVEMAGADRLGTGLDARRVELEVLGGLEVEPGAAAASVVFRAADPEQPWDGILLRPAGAGRVALPAGTYQVQDALRGILLPDAPAGAQGQITRAYRLLDDPAGDTAGNGDGRLDPGESFRIVADVSNWSLAALRGVSLRLSWDSALLARTWGSGTASPELVTGPGPLTLDPGRSARVPLPGLTLAPQARPGEQLDLVVEWAGASPARRDTVSLRVAEGGPAERVEFDAPREQVVEGSLLAEVGRAVTFRATPRWALDAVSLMVRPLDSLGVDTEVALEPRWGASARTLYLGRFVPPAPAPYMAFLRTRGPAGSARFSARRLYLWAEESTTELSPALVLFGGQYTRAMRDHMLPALQAVLEEAGLAAHVIDRAPAEGALYRALLPHWAAPGRLVIWMGRVLDIEAQDAFRAFLQRGGRVLLITPNLPSSTGSGDFLAQVVHARVSSPRRGGFWRRPLRTVHLPVPLEFRAQHTPLQVLPPARAIVLNSQDRAAGLHLDAGGYRLAYLPFELYSLEGQQVRALLPATIRFLQEGDGQAGRRGPPEPALPAGALANHPNPFNAQTTISYRLEHRAPVEVSIYDVAGQRVRQLVHREQGPGPHEVVWDGRDAGGRPVSSGVYLYHLRTPTRQQTRRLLVVK
ncbi:MAG: FlgD immunoglobulin-like domain containing protein [Candidatus Latescibacterota bacterium]